VVPTKSDSIILFTHPPSVKKMRRKRRREEKESGARERSDTSSFC
jgi:hypothetical protein